MFLHLNLFYLRNKFYLKQFNKVVLFVVLSWIYRNQLFLMEIFSLIWMFRFQIDCIYNQISTYTYVFILIAVNIVKT